MKELHNMLPEELELLIEQAQELLNQKESRSVTHHEIIETLNSPKCCPECGCTHFVKNGHHNGAQRYLCKECKTTFGNTNETLLFHTQLSYKTWIEFIKCELIGMTLRQEAEEIGVSKTTCFNLRHKLHQAMSEKRKSVSLKEDVQIDFMYKSINLKGTLPRQNAQNK